MSLRGTMADSVDPGSRVTFNRDERDGNPQPQAAAVLGAALDQSNAILERATKTLDDLLAKPMPEEPALLRNLRLRDAAANSADRPPDEAKPEPEPEGQGDVGAAG